MNESRESKEKIEKFKTLKLERQTLELLKNTRWGRIYAMVYFVVGFSSIFLYAILFKLNIIFSIFLGLTTWFVVASVVDKILIKTQRIDKQLDWLLKTPEVLAELKKKGITDEQLEKLNIRNNSLSKK